MPRDREGAADAGWWRKRPKVHKFEDLKDRASRSLGDEQEYFKVHAVCLGCGVKTRVKIARLGQKLRCRNCKTVMHMSEDGTWNLGPPPETPAGNSLWFRAQNRSYWRLQDLTRAVPILRHRVVLIALAGALVLAIGVAIANWTSTVTPPANLMGRAVFLCDALLEQDSTAFYSYVDPTTERDAAQLYDKVQARLTRTFGSSKPEIRPQVRFENNEKGTGCVVADFHSAGSAGDPAASKATTESRRLSIVLFWTKRSGGPWLLDGKRTLTDL